MLPKKQPEQFHLRKKLETAYEQGFFDGYIEACNVWEKVCELTPGIGSVLQQRMMDTVKEMANQKAAEKKG